MSTADHLIMLREGQMVQGSSQQETRRILKLAAADSKKHLAIFFHGGLVSEKGGLETMEKLIGPYSDNSYPLFFIWHSGWNEVLINALPKIVDNAVGYQQLMQYLKQMVAKKLGAELGTKSLEDRMPPLAIALEVVAAADSAGQKPQTKLNAEDEREFVDALAGDAKLQQLFNAPVQYDGNRGIAETVRTTDPFMDPQLLSRASTTEEEEGLKSFGPVQFLSPAFLGQAVKVLRKIFIRFATGRDHGIHLTISEEILRAFYVGAIGKGLWDQMKEETQAAFGDDPATFGGTALLQEIKALGPETFDRITLLGHSAGSIYIFRLLEAAHRQMPGAKFDVVFFAPAATCDLAAQQFERRPDQINRIRTFTMKDPLEQANSIFDNLADVLRPIYPSSLLYAISGLLEEMADEPILGMARFIESSRFRNLDSSVELCAKPLVDGNCSVFSKTAPQSPAGRGSQASTHGGFPTEPETLDSTKDLLAGNWG